MSSSHAQDHPRLSLFSPGYWEESLRALLPLLPCPEHTLCLLICSSSPPCCLLGADSPWPLPLANCPPSGSGGLHLDPLGTCHFPPRVLQGHPSALVQGSHPGATPSGVSCPAPLPHLLSLTLLGTHLPAQSPAGPGQLPVECQHFSAHLKTGVYFR